MKKLKLLSLFIFFTSIANAQLHQTAGPEGGFIKAFAKIGTNLFAGTDGAGVFLSNNNGNSWTAANFGLTNPDVTSFAAVGTNLFAGTINNGVTMANNKCLFLSNDYGASWTSVHTGLPNTSVYSLAVIGNNIFAGTMACGVYLSNDSGATWNSVNTGLPNNCNVTTLMVNGNDLYAGVDGSVFLSNNNGISWTVLGNSNLGSSIVGLAVSGTSLFAGVSNGGVFRFTNNGTSWMPVNVGLPPYIRSLTNSGTYLFAGTMENGVFLSVNNGTSWMPIDEGLLSSFTTVSTLMANGTDLFAGTDNGVFYTNNNGATWTALNTGLIATNVSSFAVSGTNIFAGTWGGGAFLSNDSGNSWIPVNSGLKSNKIRAMAANGSSLFAGMNNNCCGNDTCLWLSTNNGISWTAANSGLASNNVTSLAVKGNYVFAGTGGAGVYMSTNNGSSWIPINSGFTYGSGTYIYSLIASGNNLFACTDYGYVSFNNGTTWTHLNVPSGVLSFATIGTSWFAGTINGVFRSIDSGASWTQVNSGLTNSYVYSLTTNGSNLFAGTDIYGGGGGVFISNNNGNSWMQVNPGPNYPIGSTIYALAVNGSNLFIGTAGYGAGVFAVPICSITGNTNISPPEPTCSNAFICSNNTVCLSATGTGTLGWYTQASGGTYLGGGTNYTTPILTTSTTYYVQDSTCTASATRTAVIVTVNPLPIITAYATSTLICAGTNVTLLATGASSYTWSGGVTNGISFAPLSTTTYTVTGTDGNNCSNSDAITINVKPSPIITPYATETAVCAGTTVTLIATGAASYTWSGGVTSGISFVPSYTTTYTVTGTGANNCSNTDSITINVNPSPDVTTNLNGVTISANQTGAAYQWLDCNNGNSFIIGATNQSYTAITAGDYAVIITMNGCSDTSACVNITTTGINEIVNNNPLTVYPNPSHGVFTIQSTGEGSYSIMNELGQTIQLIKLNAANTYTTDIENLSTGIYFIVGFNNNQMTKQKIVVTK